MEKRQAATEQCRQELFEQVMEQYGHLLYSLCAFYFPREVFLRDDLYYDILARVWSGLPSFRRSSSLGTWVYSVASHVAGDHLRRLARLPVTRPLRPSDLEVPCDDGDDLLLDELYRLVDRLPLRDRQLVGLYLQDIPQREIAEALGITVTNVSSRIDRIKKKLRKMHEHDERNASPNL